MTDKAKDEVKADAKPKKAPARNKSKKSNDEQVVLMMPDVKDEVAAEEKKKDDALFKVLDEHDTVTLDGGQIVPLNKKKREADITPYISNVDGSVYAITGLPEEFIATLFAWVSRSPKSFKEHLKIALKDHNIKGALDSFKELDDKAKSFHEKWTVGYGHSSVAEHAVAHVGIENISRLASAELELANPFLSITEYSQRYQKPERGKWHNPLKMFKEKPKGISTANLDINPLYQKVDHFYHAAFDAFENLIDGVYTYLKKEFVHSEEYEAIKDDSKAVDRKLDALMKLAFEDARYVLPLSMHTQLGMTANGRAWRDTLAELGTSDHAESQKLADDLRAEITKVLPVLLKYATPSQYQKNSKLRVSKHFECEYDNVIAPSYDAVLLPVEEESMLINEIIAHLKVKNQLVDYPYAAAVANFGMSDETKEEIIKELLFEMQHFDNAPDAFKHIRYKAYFTVSEANWHQLLRHNRMTDFTFSKPTTKFGIKVPPRIVAAGLQDILKGIAAKSEELYNELVQNNFEKEAEYVVLNAHKRHIYASFNLWEAYHLINLRTSEQAQWDIRETFEDLYQQIKSVHPLLISEAKRRNDNAH
ncbi:hypothetical protein C2I27_03610 [Priestia megaterium]|uniref:FAD-dependent thymidylate synthase n=1 Tax=Priestia megaterium TaxID=1404 RepID=UPI000D513A1C|nr:FAD-dependent thymidylate synthase [Priestia megaterium]PVC74986.1 hypothetical protein C2I27_03610 [Priestia megaterium]